MSETYSEPGLGQQAPVAGQAEPGGHVEARRPETPDRGLDAVLERLSAPRSHSSRAAGLPADGRGPARGWRSHGPGRQRGQLVATVCGIVADDEQGHRGTVARPLEPRSKASGGRWRTVGPGDGLPEHGHAVVPVLDVDGQTHGR